MKNENSIFLAHFLFPDRKMNQGVTKLLHNSATAERVCRIQYSDDEIENDIYLQVHKDRTLTFCNNKPGALPHELNEPEDIEKACFHLFNQMDKRETSHTKFPALIMSQRKYDELYKEVNTISLHHLAGNLAAVNGDGEHSQQLARVMKYVIESGELSLCTRSSSGWYLQNASFIGDEHSGWLLRKSSDSSEDWMIAIPIVKKQFCASFTKWMLHTTSAKC